MKVLLVQPPIFGLNDRDSVWVKENFITKIYPPLGLAYVGAVLESNGFGVRILDCVATQSFEKEISRYARRFKPDAVGINNSFTINHPDVQKTAAVLKKAAHVPVFVGGTHATVCTESVLHDRNIDFVVRGEGEISALELASAIESGKSAENIDGIAYKKGKKIIVNRQRQLIKDLDSLPFPARHLLPMELYSKYDDERWSMRLPKTTMITSRGCPGVCVYCSIHCVWGGSNWRARSPKNVVDEIEHLVEKYGIREIDFEDDNLTLDKKRMHAICDEIISRKIDIKWKTPNGIAFWTLDRELLSHMKKAGCHRIQFGIESANAETQNFIRKKVDLKKVDSLIKTANDLGLWIQATFIIGFPFETRESVMETINYALKSDLDYADLYLPGVYPGTELARVMEENGFSKEINDRGTAYDTKYLKKEELQELYRMANRKMKQRIFLRFLNPLNLAKKIRSTEDFIYVLKLSKAMALASFNKQGLLYSFTNPAFLKERNKK